MRVDDIEVKAKEAFALKEKYLHLYEAGDSDEAIKVELEFLEARKEVLKMVDEDIVRQKSIPMATIKKRVLSREKKPRIETGIPELDYELVNDEMKLRHRKGGLELGNFIQISGSKGSGKSTLMLKILTGFSTTEKVSWFDFEMGEVRVVEKLSKFEHNDENLLYYSSSRELEDVVSEIKFLKQLGVNHFVIDSAMKINVSGADRYDKFSSVSSKLSELTSSLGINIYMINQMSQSSEREGFLGIKHGNDAEYDADFMFFLLKKPLLEDGKNVKDELGINMMDESVRILKCTKNRQDERLFSVEIPKHSLEGSNPTEIVYEYKEDESPNIEMPGI